MSKRLLMVALVGGVLAGCQSGGAGTAFENRSVSEWPSQQGLRAMRD